MTLSSPFEETLVRRGAVMGDAAGVRTALHYGDPAKEADGLQRAAGVVDCAWRGVIEVTGGDRARYLQGMCTNDVKKLKPGQGCMAAMVTRQGKMVAEMIVRATEGSFLLEVERSNLKSTIDALSKFLVADDVTLKETDLAVIGIHGPEAPRIVDAGALADFHFIDRDGVIISRTRPLGPEGYHLLVPASKPDELDRLLGHGVAPAGFEPFETARIRNGFPRWGADMDETVLPMEAGLDPVAISYEKGCYLGQEVIQRVKTYSESPRMLVSLTPEGPVSAGSPITVNGEEIGRVTSAVPGAALGLVRKEYKNPGIPVVIAPDVVAKVGPLAWHATLG